MPREAFRLPAPPEYGPIRIRFLGVNARHHSLALLPSPELKPPALVHIMVGCEGILVDETSYTAEEITADSYWGHKWDFGA